MTCSQARPLLPLLTYGDLPAADTQALRDHLAICAACRRESSEFQHVRAALGSVSVPAVRVDVPRLFQEAAARQVRRARRWRRMTVAACGIAAGLLLIALLRLEIQADSRQLTLRWGAPAVEDKTPLERIVVRDDSSALAALDDRVRLLDDLVHALITDVGDRDDRQTQRVALVRDRFEELRARDARRLTETERSVAAVVTALSYVPRKGEKP